MNQITKEYGNIFCFTILQTVETPKPKYKDISDDKKDAEVTLKPIVILCRKENRCSFVFLKGSNNCVFYSSMVECLLNSNRSPEIYKVESKYKEVHSKYKACIITLVDFSSWHLMDQ